MENTQLQFLNPRPPRISDGFQLTVDGTGRVYDLTGLAWGGVNYRKGEVGQSVILTLHAQTSGVYFRFLSDPSASSTINGTDYISAGSALSLQSTFGQELPSGAYVDVRIDREVDKALEVVSTSGTARLRVNLSSNPNG